MGDRLSIIIPVYNAQATLKRTLDSLLVIPREKRGRVEVVAIDDGATDSSGAILDAAAAGDGNGFSWRVIHQANAGLSIARNTGMAQATGDWLFFLDADDELAVDVLGLIDRFPGATCVGMTLTYHKQVDGREKCIRKVPSPRVTPEERLVVFSRENPFQPSSLVFQKSGVVKAFDPTVNVVNDWLFWMENPGIFAKMEVVQEVGARIHIHGANMSSKYGEAGLNREVVARRMLVQEAGELTLAARNNFEIQAQIGRIQQGKAPAPGSFLRFPCSMVLYGKLMVYTCAWCVGKKATWY
jgi:glycosyltransferase involved in cell wall biosynthesis